MMNDVEKMLVKQFLLRVRQEGYSIVENFPQSGASGINMDIYRGKTKICILDNHHLDERCSLRVTTDDSSREDIKHDYNNLFYTFLNLRNLYRMYDTAEPLLGYDCSSDFRTIVKYNECVLAIRKVGSLGELEFATFIVGGKKTVKESFAAFPLIWTVIR